MLLWRVDLLQVKFRTEALPVTAILESIDTASRVWDTPADISMNSQKKNQLVLPVEIPWSTTLAVQPGGLRRLDFTRFLPKIH